MRLLVAAALLLAAQPAAAQQAPVSGYVIDIRGATSGLPNSTAFFAGIPADTVVPARGFGFDVGANVYLFRLGAARVGIGGDYVAVRGTVPGVVSNLRTVSPQLSLNFGSRSGWSYLSAGVGRAWIKTRVDVEGESQTAESNGLTAVNYGGGARWFLTERLAVGFDARFHRISGPPRTQVFAASVGFSVR